MVIATVRSFQSNSPAEKLEDTVNKILTQIEATTEKCMTCGGNCFKGRFIMYKFGVGISLGDLDLDTVVSADSIEEAINHIRKIFKETVWIKKVILLPENIEKE